MHYFQTIIATLSQLILYVVASMLFLDITDMISPITSKYKYINKYNLHKSIVRNLISETG